MADRGRHSWVKAHPKQAGALVFVLCFLLLEGVTRVGVAVGLIPYRQYPTSRAPQFWAYNDPVVGMWHFPNTRFVHREKCIDAVYVTNSVGARDRERSRASSARRRVIVLGDSFIEGYGSRDSERLTNLLEHRTGIEHLNFATSGGFGTIQEWLLYERRARYYDHSDVLLFIFPGNDFKDNDPARFAADVYRPFLRPAANGYEVYYPVAFQKRDTAVRALSTVIKNTIDNNVFVANALRLLTAVVKDRLTADARPADAADYDNVTPAGWAVMAYALDRLAAAADPRTVYLATIPTARDFYYAKAHGYHYRLVEKLKRFAARRDNVRYMDLLPEFMRDAEATGREFRDYTLPCDNHWGPRGNDVAARAVQSWIYGTQGASPAR